MVSNFLNPRFSEGVGGGLKHGKSIISAPTTLQGLGGDIGQ